MSIAALRWLRQQPVNFACREQHIWIYLASGSAHMSCGNPMTAGHRKVPLPSRWNTAGCDLICEGAGSLLRQYTVLSASGACGQVLARVPFAVTSPPTCIVALDAEVSLCPPGENPTERTHHHAKQCVTSFWAGRAKPGLGLWLHVLSADSLGCQSCWEFSLSLMPAVAASYTWMLFGRQTPFQDHVLPGRQAPLHGHASLFLSGMTSLASAQGWLCLHLLEADSELHAFGAGQGGRGVQGHRPGPAAAQGPAPAGLPCALP